jgi:hypothetical protein
MSKKLKNCPWCGEKAVSGTNPLGIHYAGCYDTYCLGFNLVYSLETVEACEDEWNECHPSCQGGSWFNSLILVSLVVIIIFAIL